MHRFFFLSVVCLYFGTLPAAEQCGELTGRVVFPNTENYEEARLVSNYYSSKNKYPDVIVYCQSRQDVQNAVNWARCQKKTVRIRSGGHNHEAFSTGTGIVLIDVSQMKQMHVDPATHRVTLGPGLTNGELYPALFKQGLTHVGGTCAGVGLSGLVLSGGMGPLLRKRGLSCDTLLSLEMVDANGKVITATKDNEHSDLFWACQGGGAGNFGVLTSMQIQVYPAQDVTWFNLGWDWTAPLEDLITAWQKFFSTSDERWFSHLDIWAKPFPADKFHKQPLKILGVFWGSPEQAEKELEPFLKIAPPKERVIEKVNWEKAIKEFEDSTAVFITNRPEYKSTGAFALDVLPQQANALIVDTLKNSTAPLLNVLFFSMGGKAAEIPPTATAYFFRQAKFFISYNSQWLQPSDAAQHIAELDTLRNKLLPYTQGDYVGNPDRSLHDPLKIYYGENVHRLRCIKLKYDKDNLFQYEQSVPPASSTTECSQ